MTPWQLRAMRRELRDARDLSRLGPHRPVAVLMDGHVWRGHASKHLHPIARRIRRRRRLNSLGRPA